MRILDQGHGTDAITRVLIETTDGESSWVTVGVGAQRHRGVLGRAGRRRSPSGCAGSRSDRLRRRGALPAGRWSPGDPAGQVDPAGVDPVDVDALDPDLLRRGSAARAAPAARSRAAARSPCTPSSPSRWRTCVAANEYAAYGAGAPPGRPRGSGRRAAASSPAGTGRRPAAGPAGRRPDRAAAGRRSPRPATRSRSGSSSAAISPSRESNRRNTVPLPTPAACRDRVHGHRVDAVAARPAPAAARAAPRGCGRRRGAPAGARRGAAAARLGHGGHVSAAALVAGPRDGRARNRKRTAVRFAVTHPRPGAMPDPCRRPRRQPARRLREPQARRAARATRRPTASPSTSSTASASCRSTTRTSTTRPTSRPPPPRCATGSPARTASSR